MAVLKLSNVSSFLDRHGRRRYRFRRKGAPTVMLPGQPGEAAFMAAYAAALEASPASLGSYRTRPGSLSALIVAYREGAEWRELAPSTQRMHRNILERFRSATGEKNRTPYGDRPIAALAREALLRIRDKRAATPFQANKLIRVLCRMFDYAVDRKMMHTNPASGIKAIRIKSDGFHTWTADQIAAFMAKHAPGSQARLAFALLNYTGQRRADVVRMGRQHDRGDTLEVRQGKTGTALSIPITPPLRAAIDAAPKDQLTFLTTSTGAPFSPAYFGNVFARWCDEAGLPKVCRAHGIRKAVATRIADSGAGAHSIKAVTGHKRLADVQHYTLAADQKRLARGAAGALAGTEGEPDDGKPEAIVGNPAPKSLQRKGKK